MKVRFFVDDEMIVLIVFPAFIWMNVLIYVGCLCVCIVVF